MSQTQRRSVSSPAGKSSVAPLQSNLPQPFSPTSKSALAKKSAVIPPLSLKGLSPSSSSSPSTAKKVGVTISATTATTIPQKSPRHGQSPLSSRRPSATPTATSTTTPRTLTPRLGHVPPSLKKGPGTPTSPRGAPVSGGKRSQTSTTSTTTPRRFSIRMPQAPPTLSVLRTNYKNITFGKKGLRINSGPKTTSSAAERKKRFLEAIEHGDVARVEVVLRSTNTDYFDGGGGIHVDGILPNGSTPLITAVRAGHIHIVKLLLDKNADVTKVTRNGTALGAALDVKRDDLYVIILNHLLLRSIHDDMLDLSLFSSFNTLQDLPKVVNVLRQHPEVKTLKLPGLQGAIPDSMLHQLLRDLSTIPSLTEVDMGHSGSNSGCVFLFFVKELQKLLGQEMSEPSSPCVEKEFGSFARAKTQKKTEESDDDEYVNPEPDLIPMGSFGFDPVTGKVMEKSPRSSPRKRGSPRNFEDSFLGDDVDSEDAELNPQVMSRVLADTFNITHHSLREFAWITIDGVQFLQEYFLDVANRPLHYLLRAPHTTVHQHENLNLLLKVILYINLRMKDEFCKEVAGKVDPNGWTLLRLAVELGELRVLEAMFGKGHSGVYSEMVASHDREGSYVFEEFSDIWQSQKPCNIGLIPLHAAVVRVTSRPLQRKKKTEVSHPLFMENQSFSAVSHIQSSAPCTLPNCHCKVLPIPAAGVCGGCTENAAALRIVKFLITHGVIPRTVTRNGIHIVPGETWNVPFPVADPNDDRKGVQKPVREYAGTTRVATCVFDRIGVGRRCFGRNLVLIMLQYAPSCVHLVLPSDNFVTLPPCAQVISIQFLHQTERIPLCGKTTEEVMVHLRATTTRSTFEVEGHDVGMRLQHWAALRGCVNVLSLIVKDAVDVYRRTSHLKWNILHYASFAGHLDCVNLILHILKGSGPQNLEAVINDGNTFDGSNALHYATANAHLMVVNRLMDSHASALSKNKIDMSPFDVAVTLRKTHATVKNSELLPSYTRGKAIVEKLVQLFTQQNDVNAHLMDFAVKHFARNAGVYILFAIMLTVLAHVLHTDNSSEFHRLKAMSLSWENIQSPQQIITWHRTHLVPFVELFQSAIVGAVILNENTFGSASAFLDYFTAQNSSLGVIKTVYSKPTLNVGFSIKDSDTHVSSQFSATCAHLYCHTKSSLSYVMLFHSITWMTGFVALFHVCLAIFAYIMFKEEVKDLMHACKEVRVKKLREHTELMKNNVKIKKLQNAKVVLRLLAKEVEDDELIWKPKASSIPAQINQQVHKRRETMMSAERQNHGPDKHSKALRAWDKVKLSVEPLSPRNLKRSIKGFCVKSHEPVFNNNSSITQAPTGLARQKSSLTSFMSSSYNALSTSLNSRMFSAEAIENNTRRTKRFQRNVHYFLLGVTHYLSTEWNSVDLLCVVLWIGYFFCYLQGVLFGVWEQSKTNGADEDYSATIALTKTSNTIILALVVVTWLKLLKYIEVLPRVGSVTTAIVSTIMHKNISLFLLVLVGVLLNAFTSSFHFLLRDQIFEFSTFGRSYMTVFRMHLGEPLFAHIVEGSSILGSILFVCFLTSANLIMLNILIAMVSHLYADSLKQCLSEWVWKATTMYQETLPDFAVETGVVSPIVIHMLPKESLAGTDDIRLQIELALDAARSQHREILGAVRIQERVADVERKQVSLETERYELVSLQAQVAAELQVISGGKLGMKENKGVKEEHALYTKLIRQYTDAKAEFDDMMTTAKFERDAAVAALSAAKTEWNRQQAVEKDLKKQHEACTPMLKELEDQKRALSTTVSRYVEKEKEVAYQVYQINTYRSDRVNYNRRIHEQYGKYKGNVPPELVMDLAATDEKISQYLVKERVFSFPTKTTFGAHPTARRMSRFASSPNLQPVVGGGGDSPKSPRPSRTSSPHTGNISPTRDHDNQPATPPRHATFETSQDLEGVQQHHHVNDSHQHVDGSRSVPAKELELIQEIESLVYGSQTGHFVPYGDSPSGKKASSKDGVTDITFCPELDNTFVQSEGICSPTIQDQLASPIMNSESTSEFTATNTVPPPRFDEESPKREEKKPVVVIPIKPIVKRPDDQSSASRPYAIEFLQLEGKAAAPTTPPGRRPQAKKLVNLE